MDIGNELGERIRVGGDGALECLDLVNLETVGMLSCSWRHTRER